MNNKINYKIKQASIKTNNTRLSRTDFIFAYIIWTISNMYPNIVAEESSGLIS